MKVYQLMGKAPYFTNCYLITDDTGNAVAIDCSMDIEKVKAILSNDKCELKAIMITHAHGDHIETLQDFVDSFDDTSVYLSNEDAQHFGITGTIEYPSKINFGDIKIRTIHTPGHTPGGVCIMCEDLLFTGDTLFAGTVGRTDLSGGDFEVLEDSLRLILSSVHDDNTKVLPGHNHTSTIALEKQQNPYLKKILKEF